MELRDRRGAGPSNRVRDAGFFDTSDSSEAGFTEPASRDNGETIKDALALAVTLGTEPGFWSGLEFELADVADPLPARIQKGDLVFVIAKRLGGELRPSCHTYGLELRAGVEPATTRLQGGGYYQLSYRSVSVSGLLQPLNGFAVSLALRKIRLRAVFLAPAFGDLRMLGVKELTLGLRLKGNKAPPIDLSASETKMEASPLLPV